MSYVIAATIEMDPSELSEYRYQSTRTTRAIYAIDRYYFAVGKTPPSERVGKEWRKHSDQFFAARKNTVLWVCEMEAAS